MKTVISDANKVNENAAQHIKSLLAEKPDAVLAFSSGRSMTGLFSLLSDMSARGELDLSKAKVFAVTEYVGVPYDLSCRRQIEQELLNRVGVPAENRHFPPEDNFEQYDAQIAALGGIDIAVIGIGHNGHVGYNEPGTQYDSETRLQKLAPATRRQLADSFGGEEKVPEKAVTMGIKTLVDARDIIVLAFGKDKAGAVYQMLYARDDSIIPAAFLQLPMNVTVLADNDAASML
jgi:glucosamine-6-phosphate deaminase